MWKKEKDYTTNVRNCKKYWKKWIKNKEEEDGYTPDHDESCIFYGQTWDFPGRFNKTFRRRRPTQKDYQIASKPIDNGEYFGGRTRRTKKLNL